MGSVINRVENLHSTKDSLHGIPTGYVDLDKSTNGFQNGQLIGIGSESRHGRTSLCLNILENIAIQSRVKSLFVSYELTKEQLEQRMLCSQAGIPMTKLMSGIISESRDFPRIQHAAARLSLADYRFLSATNDCIEHICCAISDFARDGGKIAFVDALHSIRPAIGDEQLPRYEQLRKISRELKSIAMELNIPIVIAIRAQVIPWYLKKVKINESSFILDELDFLGVIFRREFQAESDKEIEECQGRACMVIGKNRNGQRGDVPLTFRQELMRFESRKRDESDE